MASLHFTSAPGTGALRAVSQGFAALQRSVSQIIDAIAEAREMEYLMSLTDDELAAKGIRRHDIPQMVRGSRK